MMQNKPVARLRRMSSLLVLGLLPSYAIAASTESPVAFLAKTERNFQNVDEALLETDEGYLYRLPTAVDSDFEDLYYVNLSDTLYDRLSLESLGKVVAMSEGKFAVLHLTAEKLEAVAGKLHDARASCGQLLKLEGDTVVVDRALKNALPLIPVTERIPALEDLHAQVSPDQIKSMVEKMSSLPTRHAKSSNARATTDLLVKEYSAFDRPDITVSTFAHKSAPSQPSVIVRIEGTTRPDEVLVIGSHIDSIAMFSATAPGADDNASGTSSHYEVLRVIAENNLRFERTIEIHGYAAEELGLVGSLDIAKKYDQDGVNVIAMLQNDMNMYREGTKDVIWLITNNTNKQLNADLASLAAQYQTVELRQGVLNAGSSDHAAWTRHGFPAAFPTESPTGYNRKIHTGADTIANSGKFTQSAEFSKLTLSFLSHFAGLQN